MYNAVGLAIRGLRSMLSGILVNQSSDSCLELFDHEEPFNLHEMHVDPCLVNPSLAVAPEVTRRSEVKATSKVRPLAAKTESSCLLAPENTLSSIEAITKQTISDGQTQYAEGGKVTTSATTAPSDWLSTRTNETSNNAEQSFHSVPNSLSPPASEKWIANLSKEVARLKERATNESGSGAPMMWIFKKWKIDLEPEDWFKAISPILYKKLTPTSTQLLYLKGLRNHGLRALQCQLLMYECKQEPLWLDELDPDSLKSTFTKGNLGISAIWHIVLAQGMEQFRVRYAKYCLESYAQDMRTTAYEQTKRFLTYYCSRDQKLSSRHFNSSRTDTASDFQVDSDWVWDCDMCLKDYLQEMLNTINRPGNKGTAKYSSETWKWGC